MREPIWALALILSLATFGLAARVVSAQQAAPSPGDQKAEVMEDFQLSRGMIDVERQTLVTQAMDLTAEEMQTFWPLYREYRLEAMKVGDRIVNLILAYVDVYQNLTDADADKLLNEYLSIEKERAHVKAKYLPKFKKILPSRKVVRFYQVENKLDNTILNEISSNIPLAR